MTISRPGTTRGTPRVPGRRGRSLPERCRNKAVRWRSGFRMSWARTAGKCSITWMAGYTGCTRRAVGRPERGTRSFSATRREASNVPRKRPEFARRFLIGRSKQTWTAPHQPSPDAPPARRNGRGTGSFAAHTATRVMSSAVTGQRMIRPISVPIAHGGARDSAPAWPSSAPMGSISSRRLAP